MRATLAFNGLSKSYRGNKTNASLDTYTANARKRNSYTWLSTTSFKIVTIEIKAIFKSSTYGLNISSIVLYFKFSRVNCTAEWYVNTAQKMKFSFKDFFSKCNQIRRQLRIWLHLLKKSLMENFIFSTVQRLETTVQCTVHCAYF